MKLKTILLIILFLSSPLIKSAPKGKVYDLKSPDGLISLKVETGNKLLWSVSHKEERIIEPSSIALTLEDAEILGDNAKITASKTENVNTKFNAINYRKAVVTDHYNQLTLNCKGDYGVIFRVYNDAVAYRFFTKRAGEIIIKNEEANFNFTGDHKAFLPMQNDYRDGKNFNSSFEAFYREIKLSQFPKDSLAFLPVLVDAGNRKIELMEADLEDYPGMYVDLNQTGKGFKGVFAPFPLETYTKGINIIPGKRADYIAGTSGTRNFPWRAVVITEQDKDLLNSDIIQKLASPCRITDISWIKPGQVSWDWWTNLNISHVDFRAGINTATYKYFIDFASANKIPYIILDGGWSVNGDITKARSGLDIAELVAYGNQKGVGLIVWSSWQDILRQKDQVFPFYQKIGIKGIKIDFIDRDDQLAVASTYEIAKLAAENHLIIDYHGVFKPSGLQRTYPNVVSYEGVKGMENEKWASNDDVPRYDVTIPFIRNQSGPMDYTPGAMRNSNKANFRPINYMPMSKGTRTHQLAMYIVFESPLQMLSDNPTTYMKEQECTDFIVKVPTTFDETIPLDGKVGEYVVTARRKGNSWYIGAMTNWNPRDLSIDLSFLPPGEYRAEIFSDGINADRDATDYKKEVRSVKANEQLKVKLMNGGGWAARISLNRD